MLLVLDSALDEPETGSCNAAFREAHTMSTDVTGLDLLADLANLAYFEVDAARNVTKVSPALEALTGFAAADVVGKPCITLIRCRECLKECGVFRQGRVDNVRLQIYRSDGAELDVYRSGMLLRDRSGDPQGAIETVRPVANAGSDTKIIPRELDVLLRTLGRMFIAADDQLRIVEFSPSLPAQMGWTE
ncbi:MAG: PAS domain S-box protein, partial [Gemmatimonadaceae bacterium]